MARALQKANERMEVPPTARSVGHRVGRHTSAMEISDYRALFRHLRTNPERYGVPSSLASSMIYLIACDESTDRNLFAGFSEWIKENRGDRRNDTYAWFRELIWLVLGSTEDDAIYYWDLEGDEAVRAHDILFDCVDDYLSHLE